MLAECFLLTFSVLPLLAWQDAVVKGWFRTSRLPTEGGINLRAVAVTAYEVASAMAYLHGHDVVHGVSENSLSACTVAP